MGTTLQVDEVDPHRVLVRTSEGGIVLIKIQDGGISAYLINSEGEEVGETWATFTEMHHVEEVGE